MTVVLINFAKCTIKQCSASGRLLLSASASHSICSSVFRTPSYLLLSQKYIFVLFYIFI